MFGKNVYCRFRKRFRQKQINILFKINLMIFQTAFWFTFDFFLIFIIKLGRTFVKSSEHQHSWGMLYISMQNVLIIYLVNFSIENVHDRIMSESSINVNLHQVLLPIHFRYLFQIMTANQTLLVKFFFFFFFFSIFYDVSAPVVSPFR